MFIARNVFNAAAPHYRAALSHYRLEGFVTEHCDALLDVSSLHKALAFFEDDPRDHCRRRHNTLQRRRVERIEEVLTQLSADKYPGLYKTLWFEVGEAHRAVLENKIKADRPPLSLSAAARKSADGYGKYIAAYDVPTVGDDDDAEIGGGGGGNVWNNSIKRKQPPSKVPDDEERTYLTARFVRGRVVSKSHGMGSEADALAEAMVEYEFIVDYCKRNSVKGFEQEAQLCAEMAELLPTKIDNIRRLEANDASAVDPLQHHA